MGAGDLAAFETERLRALVIDRARLAGEPDLESTEVERGTKLADIEPTELRPFGGTPSMVPRLGSTPRFS